MTELLAIIEGLYLCLGGTQIWQAHRQTFTVCPVATSFKPVLPNIREFRDIGLSGSARES